MRLLYITAATIQRLVHIPLRAVLHVCTSLEVRGLENVEKLGSNAIFAANHEHELDPLVIVSCLPFFSRHIPQIFVSREKSFYAQMGFKSYIYGGKFFSLMGAFQAYTGLNDYEKALVHHLEALRMKKSVCIFPLGTRHSDFDAEKARGGVAYLAYKTKLPIIPVRITGLEHMSLRDFILRKRTLRVTFGAPIYFEDLAYESENGLGDGTRNEYEKAAAALMKKIIALDARSR